MTYAITMRLAAGLSLAIALGGCGNRMFSPRTTNPVIEDRVRAGDSNGPKMSVLSTRADRRTILILAPDKLCAEPSPDVAEAISAQAKVDLQAKGVSLGAGSSIQTAIQQLTRRSQGLDMFRTSAFVYCNQFINGALTSDEYRDKVSAAFATSVTLIEKELGNLPEIAKALQVVGAAELKLNIAADAAAADKATAEAKKAEADAPKKTE